MNSTPSNLWGVILAGGQGQRMEHLTGRLIGQHRPQQFSAPLGGRTLLGQTRERVATIVPADRTLFVMMRSPAQYYQAELGDLSRAQLVEQPLDRGTTAAVLYGLSRVRRFAPPDTVLTLFPADHYYEDEALARRTIEEAARIAEQCPTRVVLIGAIASEPTVDYGWIEPGPPLRLNDVPTRSATEVFGFWEKPAADLAWSLFRRGCVWNTFTLAARIDALEALIASAMPRTWQVFEPLRQPHGHALEAETAALIYAHLRSSDFCRDVLVRRPERLALVRMPHVGWTDLGCPSRLRRLLETDGFAPAGPRLVAS